MSEESDSGSESDENGERSSSDEQENSKNGGSASISEYEKQRLARIRENKARLEALKLPSLATKLYGCAGKKVDKEKRKGKQKKREEDDEYKPGGDEERASSSGDEESGEDEDDDKEKMRLSKGKKKIAVLAQKHTRTVEYIDDDEALQQAIALSLGESAGIYGAILPKPSQNRGTNVSALELRQRKGRSMILETDKRNKRRKANTSRVQITEDQVIIHFFQFDDTSHKNNGWQLETLVGSGKQKCQCKYCHEIIEDACMTRLMQHLAGSSSRGAACEHVPFVVQEEMRSHLYEMQMSVSNETVRSVQQPQAVHPQVEEEEDPEVRLQKDIEEALRQSMKDPEYKEMEEVKVAMLESQRLNHHALGESSSKTPQSVTTIEDSDEELDRLLGFDDNSNDDDDMLHF